MTKIFTSNENWHALAQLMSEISEEAYFAGWMGGLEYALWDAVQNGPRRYGQITIDAEMIEALRHLSTQCGGWVRYGENEEEFVPLETWERAYVARGRSPYDR
jgi:hypothetical protein